ncbi:MAG: InlB B-repeat-containing protein [Treponema sp.]|nr:InlB B-repeat-containing protein [Treponema sp.]
MKNLKRFLLPLLLPVLMLSACSSGEESSESKRTFVLSYISRVGTVPQPLYIAEGTVLTITQLPDLECENYTFQGWYIGSERILPNAYTVKENLVLTASWKGQDCAVTFTHSDNVSGLTYTRIYETGEEITLPTSPYGSKSGLEFKGWLNGSAYYTENSTYRVTSDTTFTAYYAEMGTHTISYHHVLDGTLLEDDSNFSSARTLTESNNPQSFTESESVFISGLLKEGYTFNGWFTAETCASTEKARTFWQASQLTSDLVLYASWSMNSYTIVFDGNAGTVIDASDPQTSLYASYESQITLPQCKYELPGYEFVAWSLDPDFFTTEFDAGQKISVSTIASSFTEGDIVLYAHWRDSVNPAAPSNFTLTDIDRTSISLKWTVAGDSDLAYTRLSYKKGGDSSSTFKDFTSEEYELNSECTYTISNLTMGSTYYFTVTSYDIAGNSNVYTSSCNLIAVPRPKAYVPELTYSQSSESSLTLSWKAPSAEDYPYIEKIALYVDGEEKQSYTASQGEGDCYSKSSFDISVEPLTLYNLNFKITEKEDDSGRNNATEIEYNYYSEPDFNIALNENYPWYRYKNALGFDIDTSAITASTSYKILAECLLLDSNGNADERSKTVYEISLDSAKDLYMRNLLEPAKNYKVRLYVSVSKTINGVEYTSYAYSLARELTCSTAINGSADLGYICYSPQEYYYDKQKTGSPIGVVVGVDSVNEVTAIMALNDIGPYANYNAADSAADSLTDGGLIWSLPAKSDIESIFALDESTNVRTLSEKIVSGINRAGGSLFTASSVNESGIHTGRYITQTENTSSDYVSVFDIDGSKCGEAIEVKKDGSTGTFTVRPLAKF